MGTSKEPGVSGKSRESGQYVNPEELGIQSKFHEVVGGRDLHGRDDLSEQTGAATGDALADAVMLSLQRSPQVDVSSVKVSSKDGVVTLSGHCGSIRECRAIEDLVKTISGVISVENQMQYTYDA